MPASLQWGVPATSHALSAQRAAASASHLLVVARGAAAAATAFACHRRLLRLPPCLPCRALSLWLWRWPRVVSDLLRSPKPQETSTDRGSEVLFLAAAAAGRSLRCRRAVRGVIGCSVVLQVLGVVNPFKRGKRGTEGDMHRRGVCVHLLYIQHSGGSERGRNTAEWLKCLMHNTRASRHCAVALFAFLSFCHVVVVVASVVATCSHCQQHLGRRRDLLRRLRRLRRPSIDRRPADRA